MTNNTIQQLLPGIIAGLCGVLLTLLVAAALASPDTELQTSLQKFAQLEPEEQERLKNTHAELDRLPADDRNRILTLHRATQNDTELRTKLDGYYKWWAEQPASFRSDVTELREDAPEEWLARVSDRIQYQQSSVDEIVINLSGRNSFREEFNKEPVQISITTDQFADFLDTVAPRENLDEDRKSTLDGLENRSDQLLARTIWLLKSLAPRRGGPGPEMRPGEKPPGEKPPNPFDDLMSKAWAELVPSDMQHSMEERYKERFQQERKRFMEMRDDSERNRHSEDERMPDISVMFERMQESWQRGISMRVIGGVLDHLKKDFRKQHEPTMDDLVATYDKFYEQLSAEQKLALMSKSPAEIRQTLKSSVLADSAQGNEAVGKLAMELQELESHWERMRVPTRSFPGGPRGSGGGGQGFGRPDFGGRRSVNGDGRSPDDGGRRPPFQPGRGGRGGPR